MRKSIVQSIVIPKHIMTKANAIKWVQSNYKLKKIDETENKYRFRQYSPQYLKRQGYLQYYVYTLPNGIELVIAKK